MYVATYLTFQMRCSLKMNAEYVILIHEEIFHPFQFHQLNVFHCEQIQTSSETLGSLWLVHSRGQNK